MPELISTMPVIPLTSDCQVRFEAINPTTGAAVAGVTISQAVIYAVDPIEGSADIGDIGPMMFVPGPTPVTTPTKPAKIKGGQ